MPGDPAAGGPRCRDRLHRPEREGAVDLLRIGPEEADEHAVLAAGGAVVEQDLEALHRVSRPRVVAGDGEVDPGRMRGLIAALNLSGELILHEVHVPRRDVEDLSRIAEQM